MNDNPIDGFGLIIDDNGLNTHAMLVREGCGSSSCAMEWYVSKVVTPMLMPWLGDGLNIHLSVAEMDALYKAVKAVRKAYGKNLRHSR